MHKCGTNMFNGKHLNFDVSTTVGFTSIDTSALEASEQVSRITCNTLDIIVALAKLGVPVKNNFLHSSQSSPESVHSKVFQLKTVCTFSIDSVHDIHVQ